MLCICTARAWQLPYERQDHAMSSAEFPIPPAGIAGSIGALGPGRCLRSSGLTARLRPLQAVE
eukprot:5740123-Alexandrium_andersonii.AAC.1